MVVPFRGFALHSGHSGRNIAQPALGVNTHTLHDLKFQTIEGGQFRMVTHYGVEPEDVDAALGMVRRAVGELAGG